MKKNRDIYVLELEGMYTSKNLIMQLNDEGIGLDKFIIVTDEEDANI